MKKVTSNTKKLELKKTAIANLQMSEGKMMLVIAGNNTDNGTKLNVNEDGACTSRILTTRPTTHII
jgi:Cu/Ag efflux protein CusF